MGLSLQLPEIKKPSNVSPDSTVSVLYMLQEQKQHLTDHCRTHIEQVCELDIDRDPEFVRQSSLVCTLGNSKDNKYFSGDSWDSVEEITKMIKNGMNIVILNLSMGSYDYYRKVIKRVRDIEKSLKYNPSVGIAMDISPPIVTTGLINNVKWSIFSFSRV